MAKRLKISKSSIHDAVLFMVVLMTVLLSKSYYFGVANRRFYQYVYYTVVILGMIAIGVNRKQINTNLMKLIPLLVLFIFNILLHIEDMSGSDINQIFGNILVFICCVFFASYISKEKFAEYYIKTIAIICIISLPCLLIATFNQDLAYSLCQPGYNWRVPVGYSFYYTWGWNGTIFTRNSGIFWEPGAFQGFIVVALLLLLYDVASDKNGKSLLKKKNALLILFIISILTTQSSTGYILLTIILVTHFGRIEKIFGEKHNKQLRFVFVGIVILMAIYVIVSSNNISNKLNLSNSYSATVRLKDFLGGGILVMKGGLFGLGETASRSMLRIAFNVSANDSVGLFSMTYTYGIVFGFVYVYLMIKGIFRVFNLEKLTEGTIILVIYLILHLTEGLWNLPVYVMVLFLNGNRKQRIR